MSGAVRIVDMPDLGAVSDTSSMVGEQAGSGRFSAPALRSYVSNTGTVTPAGGTAARTIAARMGDMLSVKDFGAAGDGSTDDTVAINAALASGSSLYFPAGTYNVTGALTVIAAGQRLYGAGEMAATIRTNAATGDVLTISGTDLDLGHIGFAASATRTGWGAFINLGNSSQIRVHDFYMSGWFVGVNVGVGGSAGGNSVYVEKGTLLAGVANGFGIQCNAGVVAVLRDLLIEGNSTGTQPQAGVSIGAFGDITLDHVATVWAGNGVQISPPAGTNTQSVFIVNSLFDSGSGWGIFVDAIGAGSQVQLLQIDTCWVASNGSGGICLATGAGVGLVQQTDIINTISSNNTGNGLFFGPRVGYTRCIGCSLSANTGSGIWVDPNTGIFQILGNTMGASGEFLGNAVGITVNSGCDTFMVANNNLNGNTTAPMNLGASLPGIRGATYWIKDNTGFVTRGSGTLVTTAGPATFTVSHGLSWTPNVSEVRLTLNSGLGTAAYFYAFNPTTTTFDVVFNTAPGAGVTIGWDIRTLGN